VLVFSTPRIVILSIREGGAEGVGLSSFNHRGHGVYRAFDSFAMSYRKSYNYHDGWLSIIKENGELLSGLPKEALTSEKAFRDYVTIGSHRGKEFKPTVRELSASALNDFLDFINSKAQFDMDATLFDAFNAAFRQKCC
jgi:hypothetical protein